MSFHSHLFRNRYIYFFSLMMQKKEENAFFKKNSNSIVLELENMCMASFFLQSNNIEYDQSSLMAWRRERRRRSNVIGWIYMKKTKPNWMNMWENGILNSRSTTNYDDVKSLFLFNMKESNGGKNQIQITFSFIWEFNNTQHRESAQLFPFWCFHVYKK